MTTTIIGFIFAFLVSLLATWLMQPVSHWIGAVDKPDRFRKIHADAMPRLGGLGVFIGFLVPVGALVVFGQNLAVAQSLLLGNLQLSGLLIGATAALAMGMVDDIGDLRPRYKLIVQLIAALIAYYSGFRIHDILLPFWGNVHLGILSLPLTLFWFLGCMNAINLMDGLDGLAGGISLFVTLTLMLVSLYFGRMPVLFLTACLSGAILGFLMHNFHPAMIFLGDCGSMMLGFFIAALALQGSCKTEATVSLLIPIVALGLPIFDTSVAILRRWSKRLPISAADKGHIHHILMHLGLSHRSTVLVLYLVCIALGAVSLLVAVSDNEIGILVLGALAILTFVCIRILGGIRFEDILNRLHHGLKRQKLTNAAKIAVQKVVHRLDHAKTLDDLWETCCEGFEELSIDHATLSIYRKDTDPLILDWCFNKENPHERRELVPESWQACLELRYDDQLLGTFQVLRHMDDRLHVLEVPMLLADLRRAIARRLAAIS